jgi:hypothetical protein
MTGIRAEGVTFVFSALSVTSVVHAFVLLLYKKKVRPIFQNIPLLV